MGRSALVRLSSPARLVSSPLVLPAKAGTQQIRAETKANLGLSPHRNAASHLHGTLAPMVFRCAMNAPTFEGYLADENCAMFHP